LEKRRKKLQTAIGDPLSRLERGLKKILYHAGNTIELDDDIVEALETLRDGSLPEKDVLEELLDQLPALLNDHDILNGRYQESFLTALNDLEKIPEKQDERESLETEIQAIKEEIDAFPKKKKRKKLQDVTNDLQSKLQQRRQQINDIKDTIETKQDVINDHIHAVEQLMNDEFRDEIDIVRQE
jgi:peptidoglycan hydrolase CwlO-like protein